MAKTLLEELEDMLLVDKGEVYYRARARSARVRGNLPVLEPPSQGEKFKGFGQNPYGDGTVITRKPKNERLEVENFTVSLPPSSTIQTATYYPKKQVLYVSFKSGSTYKYDEVPIQTVRIWMVAASAGSFFYYNIRTSYDYTKVG